MPGEQAVDEPAETPQSHWERNTFYVVMDTVLESMRNRFEINKNLLASYHLFSPTNFDSLINDCHATAQDLKIKLNDFCTKFDIDICTKYDQCASELLSLAAAFSRLRVQLFQEGINGVSSQDIDRSVS